MLYLNTKNPNFGIPNMGLGMENVSILYGHFGGLYDHLVYFSIFSWGLIWLSVRPF
jgi:hypothetical protein